MSAEPGGVAVLAQGGGPTPVMNASLVGVIDEARSWSGIRELYGARGGVAGILEEDFIDLFRQDPERLLAVAQAPSSALGSSRHNLTPADLERMLEVFRAHQVRWFLYTGGNGSMGTAAEIAAFARAAGCELQVVGIPKTIDNDLAGTDHSPGYASAARFFAAAVRDIGADNRALPGQVEFIEILGRNTGWIVAATALARRNPDDAPHLIYFPEQRLPLEQLLDDVGSVFRRLGRCVVAVCEGQLDENGEAFGADVRPGSRGKLAMNLAHRLAMLTAERLKLRTRSEKPGLLGRASLSDPSPVDRREADQCGRAAVRAMRNGASGVMVTLVRGDGPEYSVTTGLTPLERVACVERQFPAGWRDRAGNGVSPGFLDYVAPLVGPLRRYERLAPISVTKILGSPGKGNQP